MKRRSRDSLGPAPFTDRAARRGMTLGQTLTAGSAIAVIVASCVLWPAGAAARIMVVIQGAFLVMAGWRLALIAAGVGAGQASPPDQTDVPLPRYTVLVALLDEADVLPQLIKRLSRIDYPPERLEAILLLEAHDLPTIAAARSTPRPHWMRVLVCPPGSPMTKPRALNFGLGGATGELVTVYDAEDDPHPLQLREAAAAFRTDASGRLAAFQAPLRIRSPAHTYSPFLDRQFAAEYAALFEVTLPAMRRLGLPFPLGGTSNHFRVDHLRQVGGWDPHNVTEDADLGFRLWRSGFELGVLSRPTYEPPPGDLEVWLPQRTRWLKGFLQTLGVHTRGFRGLGWRGAAALTFAIAAPLLAAAVHAFAVAGGLALLVVPLAGGLAPYTSAFAVVVLIIGATAAWLQTWIGARRAGIDYGVVDMMLAPAYWSLLTLAFGHAVWRLVRDPFTWDKTRHQPDALPEIHETADAGREAA